MTSGVFVGRCDRSHIHPIRREIVELLNDEQKAHLILRTRIITDPQPLTGNQIHNPGLNHFEAQIHDTTCPLDYGPPPLPKSEEEIARYLELESKRAELELRERLRQSQINREHPAQAGSSSSSSKMSSTRPPRSTTSKGPERIPAKPLEKESKKASVPKAKDTPVAKEPTTPKRASTSRTRSATPKIPTPKAAPTPKPEESKKPGPKSKTTPRVTRSATKTTKPSRQSSSSSIDPPLRELRVQLEDICTSTTTESSIPVTSASSAPETPAPSRPRSPLGRRAADSVEQADIIEVDLTSAPETPGSMSVDSDNYLVLDDLEGLRQEMSVDATTTDEEDIRRVRVSASENIATSSTAQKEETPPPAYEDVVKEKASTSQPMEANVQERPIVHVPPTPKPAPEPEHVPEILIEASSNPIPEMATNSSGNENTSINPPEINITIEPIPQVVERPTEPIPMPAPPVREPSPIRVNTRYAESADRGAQFLFIATCDNREVRSSACEITDAIRRRIEQVISEHTARFHVTTRNFRWDGVLSNESGRSDPLPPEQPFYREEVFQQGTLEYEILAGLIFEKKLQEAFAEGKKRQHNTPTQSEVEEEPPLKGVGRGSTRPRSGTDSSSRTSPRDPRKSRSSTPTSRESRPQKTRKICLVTSQRDIEREWRRGGEHVHSRYECQCDEFGYLNYRVFQPIPELEDRWRISSHYRKEEMLLHHYIRDFPSIDIGNFKPLCANWYLNPKSGVFSGGRLDFFKYIVPIVELNLVTRVRPSVETVPVRFILDICTNGSYLDSHMDLQPEVVSLVRRHSVEWREKTTHRVPWIYRTHAFTSQSEVRMDSYEYAYDSNGAIDVGHRLPLMFYKLREKIIKQPILGWNVLRQYSIMVTEGGEYLWMIRPKVNQIEPIAYRLRVCEWRCVKAAVRRDPNLKFIDPTFHGAIKNKRYFEREGKSYLLRTSDVFDTATETVKEWAEDRLHPDCNIDVPEMVERMGLRLIDNPHEDKRDLNEGRQ